MIRIQCFLNIHHHNVSIRTNQTPSRHEAILDIEFFESGIPIHIHGSRVQSHQLLTHQVNVWVPVKVGLDVDMSHHSIHDIAVACIINNNNRAVQALVGSLEADIVQLDISLGTRNVHVW